MHRIIANCRAYTTAIMIALCVSIGAGNCHIPLPMTVDKDLTLPFPCQSKGCGCRDAEQCWASCCCHSDAEKLAWAAANGVQPPIWFEARTPPAKTPTAAIEKGCCCSSPSPKQKSNSPTCCESKTKQCCTPASPQRDTRPVRLTLQEQRGCHGLEDGVADCSLKLVLAARTANYLPIGSEALDCFERQLTADGLRWNEPVPG